MGARLKTYSDLAYNITHSHSQGDLENREARATSYSRAFKSLQRECPKIAQDAAKSFPLIDRNSLTIRDFHIWVGVICAPSDFQGSAVKGLRPDDLFAHEKPAILRRDIAGFRDAKFHDFVALSRPDADAERVLPVGFQVRRSRINGFATPEHGLSLLLKGRYLEQTV
jgi:hypothetical protein